MDTLRALVVDDDAIAAEIVMMALAREGFECDYAVDGEDALTRLGAAGATTYDVVVTDLRMPNMHGHALVVELLQSQPRPVLIVHSAVDDPRLTKDLLVRGVDDIVYKPVNTELLAAKVKAVVSRRQTHQREEACMSNQERTAAGKGASESMQDVLVPIADIEERISLISRIRPVSPRALEIYELTRAGCDATQLAAAIQADPTLASQVLSIANSSFYIPGGDAISEVDKAVVRIGQRRIGDLAVAAATLSMLTERKLPWLDRQAIWRQSVAAGVAVAHLVKQGKHVEIAEGLELIAIVNSLGRVVLGALYPHHYRMMVDQCTAKGDALLERESQVFPENHARIMGRLLAAWDLPAENFQVMNYLLDSYGSLSRLPEPARSRVELVKLAVFVAQLATRAWHGWDLVEIPPAFLAKRLRLHDLANVLEQTRTDTELIVAHVLPPEDEAALRREVNAEAAHAIYYKNVSALPFDFVAEVIRAMDFRLAAPPEYAGRGGKLVINALGASEDPRFILKPGVEGVALVITDRQWPGEVDEPHLRMLRMPASYSKLAAALVAMAADKPRGKAAAGSLGCDMTV